MDGTSSRREFLAAASAAAAIAAAGGLAPNVLGGRGNVSRKNLKILFLGGTGFLGPHFVRAAVEAGHELTLFNRGSRDELFPDLELIVGNRIVGEGEGLDPLKAEVEKGRRWDVVIDTASVHQWVENSAAVLKGAADQYLYVSSLSVYASVSDEGRTETDPVATMPDDVADSIDRLPYDMQYYGAVKGRSEAAAEANFGGKATIVRPGLIVGPRDQTHRFTYWPARIRKGGRVVAPGNPSDPVMFLDVRDVAAFMLSCVEHQHFGKYNCNGPLDHGTTIGTLLEHCKEVTGSDAEFTWVDADFLSERGIGMWVQMPVWIPPVGEYAGFHKTSLAKAKNAGLTTRPMDETIRDTLEWFDEWLPRVAEERGYAYTPGAGAPGITPEQEEQVLREWAEHLSKSDG